MDKGMSQETLKEVVDKYGLITVLGMLEEMTANSKCPVARAVCEGLHETVNRVALILLRLRIKK